MAAVARLVGQAAGVVASVASYIPGGQVIAAVAAGISIIAGIGAQVLAKPPTAEGQINERVIGANQPLPYLIGRSYLGGAQVHDAGYGGEVNDVENPYRWIVCVHSVCGPIKSIGPTLANWQEIGFSGGNAVGYYHDFWYRDTQLGARPEATALTPHFSGAPGWGASYKLSGFAATGHNLRWDKKGKRFAGGQIPVFGQVAEGVSVYDPRLDSTFPGGSGPQRITDEGSWAYSRNPALHALAYAYGRYMNGLKIFGVDLGGDAIDIANVAAWANVCDANSWFVDGTIYEPGNKWENLKRICQAGGAKPVRLGGILRFDWFGPRTSLYTIRRDDLAAGPIRDQAGRRWRERHNTIVPRYRSEAHQWEFVQSEPVSVAAYVTEDGEEKLDEIQFDLVTGKDQAAQLALYELYQRRELGPFTRVLKPHMRMFEPGDCLTLTAEISPLGVDVKVKLTDRTIDPLSGQITASFEVESDGKHTPSLAATGTAPPTIDLPSLEDIENAISNNLDPPGLKQNLIAISTTVPGTPGQAIMSADDSTITVRNHTRVYSDKSVSVTGSTLTADDTATALAANTRYWVYYDDAGRAGGAVTFRATRDATAGFNSAAHPDRHAVGSIRMDTVGGGGSDGGGQFPPGWQEDDLYWGNPDYNEP